IHDDIAKHFSCIFIRDPKAEKKVMSVRLDYTRNIIANKAKHILELQPLGNSRLAKMLSLIYIGDFISVYLALLNNKDPTPVNYIQSLKNELKQKVNLQAEITSEIEKKLK
ncbi:MAG: SIS domain-containing protein, partial [Promethearchaeota archaeon]